MVLFSVVRLFVGVCLFVSRRHNFSYFLEPFEISTIKKYMGANMVKSSDKFENGCSPMQCNAARGGDLTSLTFRLSSLLTVVRQYGKFAGFLIVLSG